MKTNQLFTGLLLLAFPCLSKAQTNTFPASGNVGIGTTAPDQKLTIKGGGIGFDGNSVDKKLYSPADGVLEWMTHDLAAERAFAVSHQGTQRVYLSALGNSYLIGGNLGLGTKTPGTKLDVGGVIRTFNKDNSAAYWDNISLWSDGSTGRIESDGDENGLHIRSLTGGKIILESNVGIGTSNPLFKLDVEGWGARVKNSSRDYNAYSTLRLQGPDYANGLEIDFFGNDNITADPNWSYGGGKGTASIVNVNPKPLVLGTNNQGRLLIDGSGNIGIGTVSTTDPNYRLFVEKGIRTRKVKVDQTTWADYVFEPTYTLLSLKEVEAFIKAHKHLPDVPSQKEVEEKGLDLGEGQAILLKKIEELTLYVIEQNKRIEKLEAANQQLLLEKATITTTKSK